MSKIWSLEFSISRSLSWQHQDFNWFFKRLNALYVTLKNLRHYLSQRVSYITFFGDKGVQNRNRAHDITNSIKCRLIKERNSSHAGVSNLSLDLQVLKVNTEIFLFDVEWNELSVTEKWWNLSQFLSFLHSLSQSNINLSEF